MINLVGPLITSLAVSAFIFPILIKYSHKKKIWDELSHRRIHQRLTPSIGGVAIFIGFVTALLIWQDLHWPELRTFLGILFIVFVLGLCDDLVHIKPVVKMGGQTVAGALAFFLLNTRITSFYGLISDVSFAPWLSFFITLFVIIIITNSFNLIDGIDGLAGTFSGLCLLLFGIWFYLVGDLNFSIATFCMLGGVIGFLIFNWEPSKIFMGDTGALLIGMMLSILTIRFMNINFSLPGTSPIKFQSTVFTAVCFLIIPMLDTSRIIIIRVSKGISPLTPDKRHIHHTLVRSGLSHQAAVLVLAAVYIFALSIGFMLRKFSDWYMAGFALSFGIVFNLVLSRIVLNKTED
jgi:UDP-GlcNAc:undecaprenyl-phosphate GlcNAc-1-phosphate transferase